MSQLLTYYERFAGPAYLALQSLLLLLIRLKWGGDFFSTGQGKLANHAQVVGFFTSLGIPFPEMNAWFVGGVEMVGGLLLLLGLATRPMAAVLTVNMLVAYLSVEADRAAFLNAFSDSDAFVAASPFFFLLTSLLCLAFGPGQLSLDRLLAPAIGRWTLRWRPQTLGASAA